jgi:(1->4)-alpha-D-glucan 1-alpha-D-glucosylmutase
VDARLKTITESPLSTYRLQFTPSFRFEDARKIVPYLADLGIGYLYASPYLKARPGSEHGYDVVDPNKLNPEIGTPEEHAALIDASQAEGIGHLLDFVPNHMGIGVENPWWQDVLEWGEASPFAEFFDIDWFPLRSEMRGKVLVPSLGDYYGRVLERGELKLAFDATAGTISVAYFENRFPLATKSYGELLALAAEKLAGAAWALRALAAEFDDASRGRALELKSELTGVAKDPAARAAIEAALKAYDPEGDAAAIDRLDGLLQQQNFRLAYWRVSADEINYRRFFDVNDLAGVRVEDAEVLAQTHRFVFELIASGRIQGLRIDHVDGLYTPGGYCELLQDRAAALGHPQYLVVEKILARFEHLRKDWRIAGTTGYDFMNLVNGVFVDAKAESAFDRLYRQFAGISGTFEQFANRAKKDIMRTSLASELEVLATMLDRLAKLDRRSNDYTFNVLRDALVETVAAFPVYRTYVTSEQVEEDDRRFIDWALGSARKRSDLGDERVFDFIESLLTMNASQISSNYDRRQVLRFAMKFQQYTSPVMAKAVEDTAFYRYVRLVSLNEVGGDPRRFGTSVAAFHRANAERARDFPSAMLATATHDHKRGEDTRTRIDALSEMPGLWDRTIKRWGRLNARRKTSVDDAAAPTDNDEYLIYQILIGTWPAEWLSLDTFDSEELETYLARIAAYLRKALREAKFRTSWTNPNEAYEAAAIGFARTILAGERGAPFVRELRVFARECATLGALSSLAQVTLKLTSPGVPDIYQGCELWDLSLVDPDNRRPVDYEARHAAIGEMKARVERGEAAALASELLRTWPDGRVKLYVTWRLLRLRSEDPAFAAADYVPLETTGTRGDHIVGFARGRAIVVVPRLVRSIFERSDDMPKLVYHGETIRLRPEDGPRLIERFTGRTFEVRHDAAGAYLAAADVLGTFPVAVLLPA